MPIPAKQLAKTFDSWLRPAPRGYGQLVGPFFAPLTPIVGKKLAETVYGAVTDVNGTVVTGNAQIQETAKIDPASSYAGAETNRQAVGYFETRLAPYVKQLCIVKDGRGQFWTIEQEPNLQAATGLMGVGVKLSFLDANKLPTGVS